MKKVLSFVLVCALLLGTVLTLASCGNISESYAKKINKAADNDKHYTYDEVMKDLGDDAIDVTVDVPIVGRNGFIYAVKGVDSFEDLEEKIDDGETLKGIIVTIADGKATKAVYREISEDDF